ncbi:metalloregulator ArsR/SmtB family transcription factor [Patescibacteria group bacterium]|nr:metalloregulator ArsR/SmtB family transcription factor [Patescibacteria group bacterium]MBU2259143.1 metalloregulator ArsR/SmtB family transcription factor [Patescibacteria group bacterium]
MNHLRKLEIFNKSLANSKRLQILAFLKKKGSAVVSDIADGIHLKFKSTSKHLQILERAHIIERKKKGLFVYYSLSTKKGPVLESELKLL